MSIFKNPSWWRHEYDAAWEHVKEVFRNDWLRGKHDLVPENPEDEWDGENTQPVLAEAEEPYAETESAYRFGFGAYRHFMYEFPVWSESLEGELQSEWLALHPDDDDAWDRNARAIRRGWEGLEEAKMK